MVNDLYQRQQQENTVSSLGMINGTGVLEKKNPANEVVMVNPLSTGSQNLPGSFPKAAPSPDLPIQCMPQGLPIAANGVP